MRAEAIGPFCVVLLAVLSNPSEGIAQVEFGQGSAFPIYNSTVFYDLVSITGAPSCAVVDSCTFYFTGTYPDPQDVRVRCHDQSATQIVRLWNQSAGVFERTVTTSLFKGLPVNGLWYIDAQDIVPPAGNEPLGYIDEWWIRIYYKCIPRVANAVYDNIQVLKDADLDGYAEEFAFDIIVDAVTDGPPIDVKAKLTELESGRVFWTSVWTVDDVFSNPHTTHLTDAQFVDEFSGETWLRWDVGLYSANGAELYHDYPFDLSWGPVYVEPYVPYLDACYISQFSGNDANGDGYYETFSFNVNVKADVKAGSQDVSAYITCESTGQSWYMFWWTITGTGNQVQAYTLTDQDFAGHLTGDMDLNFSVRLYDEFGAELYDEKAVAGGPVKADGGGLVEEVTVSGTMRFLDVFGETHPIRYARVKVYDADPPGAEYQTATNDTGGFSLVIPNDPDGDGTGADISVEVFTIGVPFTSPVPMQDHEIVSVVKPGSYELHAIARVVAYDDTLAGVTADITAPNADSLDGVFSVYEAMIEGYLQAHTHFGLRMEPIVVLWPHPTTTVYIGTATGTPDTIKVTRGNRWDWDVLIHEYGHGVAEHNYIGRGDTGPVGPHDWHSDLRYHELTDTSRTFDQAANYAFREAWPTWFAVGSRFASTGDRVYHDLDDTLDYPSNYDYQLELDLDTTTAQTVSPGEVYESMNCATLWDIFDNNDDPTDYNDNLSIGMDTTWSVYRIPPFPEINNVADFWNKWFTLPIGSGTNRAMTDIFLDHQMSFVPQRPTVATPANGATNVLTPVVFTWDAVQQATSYDVYLGEYPGPLYYTLVHSGSGRWFSVKNLDSNTTYYWEIIAKNGDAEARSLTWSFTTCNCVTCGCDCRFQCDYDADGFLTTLDLGNMIDVLFAGKPDIQDPCCGTTRMDFDADGFDAILDLGKLVDHLFAGKTAPIDPCSK